MQNPFCLVCLLLTPPSLAAIHEVFQRRALRAALGAWWQSDDFVYTL
jgi:hypothetical protein